MRAALGLVLVYAAMVSAWIGVGLFMTLSPARFGDLIHDNFGLFPTVGPHHRVKRLLLRLIGMGLLAFAARFLWRVFELLLRSGRSGQG